MTPSVEGAWGEAYTTSRRDRAGLRVSRYLSGYRAVGFVLTSTLAVPVELQRWIQSLRRTQARRRTTTRSRARQHAKHAAVLA